MNPVAPDCFLIWIVAISFYFHISLIFYRLAHVIFNRFFTTYKPLLFKILWYFPNLFLANRSFYYYPPSIYHRVNVPME